MNATRAKRQAEIASDESPAVVPQTTPKTIGYGHPEYQFVQAIMEMQKSIGEVKASVESLREAVNSTKSKVDTLVQWKNMIVGGAVVFGFVCSSLGFLFVKGWDYISFKNPAAQVQQMQAPAQPVIQTPPQQEAPQAQGKKARGTS